MNCRTRVVMPLLLAAAFTGAGAQPSTVILVRHAERAAEPRNDPGLTDAGRDRARALADALAGARVTRVVTTHLQRTQLTAQYVSAFVGAAPIIVRAGSPTAAHIDSVAAAVRGLPAGEVVLVVGHSNTVPAIVGALGGPNLPDLCEAQYSMLYILEFPASGPPRFIQATYGAADPPASADCSRAMKR